MAEYSLITIVSYSGPWFRPLIAHWIMDFPLPLSWRSDLRGIFSLLCSSSTLQFFPWVPSSWILDRELQIWLVFFPLHPVSCKTWQGSISILPSLFTARSEADVEDSPAFCLRRQVLLAHTKVCTIAATPSLRSTFRDCSVFSSTSVAWKHPQMYMVVTLY